jgi:hypothetical protein
VEVIVAVVEAAAAVALSVGDAENTDGATGPATLSPSAAPYCAPRDTLGMGKMRHRDTRKTTLQPRTGAVSAPPASTSALAAISPQEPLSAILPNRPTLVRNLPFSHSGDGRVFDIVHIASC